MIFWGCPRAPDQATVRTAFYRLAGDLHPDRYHTLADHDLKEQLEIIYSRVCEGYRVLTTPEKRAAYERALNQGKKRLTAHDCASHAPQNPEDSLRHPEAKKFFRMGNYPPGTQGLEGRDDEFQLRAHLRADSDEQYERRSDNNKAWDVSLEVRRQRARGASMLSGVERARRTRLVFCF